MICRKACFLEVFLGLVLGSYVLEKCGVFGRCCDGVLEGVQFWEVFREMFGTVLGGIVWKRMFRKMCHDVLGEVLF